MLDAKGCLLHVSEREQSVALSKVMTESKDNHLPNFWWNMYFFYILLISGF